MVAGGDLTFTSGSVNGNVIHGGSVNLSAVSVNGTVSQGTPIDFAAEGALLEEVSLGAAALPVNGSKSNYWGTLILTGSHPDLNVFEVTQGELLGAWGGLRIEAPASSTVLVNVLGASPTMRYFTTTLTGVPREQVLFNFPGATYLHLEGITVQGTMLAPRAALTCSSSVINGTLVARSMSWSCEPHLFPFRGCLAPLPWPWPFWACNPPHNSALAAHGNTDWHIDTAHEFLFGVDMAGNPTAANHCPATWTRRHLHVGATGTRDYYYDTDRDTRGLDTDPVHGIDRAMLFFYAGHGNPVLWNTLGNNTSQSGVSLGDCPDGMLRYYWQCSCKVFAHGPRDCPGSSLAYACPAAFDGSPDSSSMRNVYERWGPALNPPLRMACGSSTNAWCHQTEVNAVWYRYNQLGFDVADSYLFGMIVNGAGAVPLCMTLGGGDVNAIPLIQDHRFTNLPNTSGSSMYYIAFIVYNSPPSVATQSSSAIPEALPILTLGKTALPPGLRGRKLLAEGEMRVTADDLGERGPRFAVDRRSGAVYFRGDRRPAQAADLDDHRYIGQARAFLHRQGWGEAGGGAPRVARLAFEGRHAESDEVLVRGQKNALVTFPRQIQVAGRKIPVLGLGGEIAVQLNNDGSVANAAKVWRPVAERREPVPVKPYEQAYEEAVGQLADPFAYRLHDWEWGYKEEPGNVEQATMRVVYHFYFLPADPEAGEEYAPRMIEIAAQEG